LQNESLLANSHLIGGTALALQIGHRISEDLDFFFKSRHLPKENIGRLISQLETERMRAERNDDERAYAEFSVAGESLHDYQQNFILNGVKVSFVVADPITADLLTSPANPARPVVATARELFDTKALVIELRNKSRDRLDLYVLMKEHKFTVEDFFSAYRKAGRGKYACQALGKLASMTDLSQNDEGCAHLMSPAPSLAEMQFFFKEQYLASGKISLSNKPSPEQVKKTTGIKM
jgi:predicted nucleotidyltransferase component of viral defense system